MPARWDNIKGTFMAVTAFIACPCHLPLTLPLLLGLTAGTALGAWLSQNLMFVTITSAVYFLGGLALAFKWLGAGNSRRTAGQDQGLPLQGSATGACLDCKPVQAAGPERRAAHDYDYEEVTG